jgi:hypothetical protein
MIVTARLAGEIRAERVSCAFVPPAHAARWRVGRPVKLRRLTVIDGDRSLVVVTDPARDGAEREPVVVTPVAFSDVRPLAAVTLKQALRAGFLTTADFRAAWTELYRVEAAAVEIVFKLGDWSDRPRMLAAGRRGADERGYTTSTALALDDAECVDDRWLAKFAKAASPFIEAKQTERRREQDAKRQGRAQPHHKENAV